jgi:AmmeMemoRadiSam system protein B/AmmeMemoRadiSam system protein A
MKSDTIVSEDAMKGERIVAWMLGFGLAVAPLAAQGVRKAVKAGQFYDADAAMLSARIDGFLAAAGGAGAAAPDLIRAIIVPHAGYVYSGPVAGRAYRLVQGRDIATVVILGPSHSVGFEGASIYPEGGFETPLGIAEVDAPAAKALIRASGFAFVPEAHADEHSIEVQVPFIQKVLPKAKIVPVVLGFPSEKTVRALAAALDKVFKGAKVLIVASTDMSHFLTRPEANALDKSTIDLVTGQKVPALLRKLERNENILCGGAAVVTALLYAQKQGNAEVRVLAYADSSEAGGPADRVVGYFAAAVTAGGPDPGPAQRDPAGGPRVSRSASEAGPQSAFALAEDDKKELLSLARRSVELYVREGKLLATATENPNLKAPRGAFVTLTEGGTLRGCIGFTEPRFPLYETVMQAAIYAATEDPRFRAVNRLELERLDYEISVLTPLSKVENPALVEVGRHGLVVAKDGKRGLLLPQVATENRWNREEFLRQTCLKAGLPSDAWRKGAEIYSFEAIVFREEKK